MNERDDADRYQGRALLRLLECYVLWAIDELEPGDATSLAEMEPKLRSLYQKEGSWQEVLAAVMEFPDEMPELIRGSWEKNTRIAQENRVVLSPEEFARSFADANFLR